MAQGNYEKSKNIKQIFWLSQQLLIRAVVAEWSIACACRAHARKGYVSSNLTGSTIMRLLKFKIIVFDKLAVLVWDIQMVFWNLKMKLFGKIEHLNKKLEDITPN